MRLVGHQGIFLFFVHGSDRVYQTLVRLRTLTRYGCCIRLNRGQCILFNKHRISLKLKLRRLKGFIYQKISMPGLLAIGIFVEVKEATIPHLFSFGLVGHLMDVLVVIPHPMPVVLDVGDVMASF